MISLLWLAVGPQSIRDIINIKINSTAINYGYPFDYIALVVSAKGGIPIKEGRGIFLCTCGYVGPSVVPKNNLCIQ